MVNPKIYRSGRRILFIPAGTNQIPEGAEGFDIPGVLFTHRRGHCSFHTMVKEHQLTDPVLVRIARIVDEADTVQEISLEPVAAGLDFICRGIRLSSEDGHDALRKGNLIYEALYAQISEQLKQHNK